MNKDKISLNDNCFDIIRLVCTFTVFFGHFLTHFSIQNDLLHGIAYFVRGVPVFFFLSGLFIARSLERYDTIEYLKRRAIRIFPELWVCVFLNLLIIVISYAGKPTIKDILIYLSTQMTAFQFYTGEWLRGYGVGVPNGALWTITVDIQFYIIAIFLIKWLKGKEKNAWIVIIIASMLIDLLFEKTKGYYPEIVYKLLECNIFSFLWIFLVGMFVYYFKDELIHKLVKSRWALLIIYAIWQYIVPNECIQIFEGIRYNLITTIILISVVTGFGFSFKKRLKNDYSYSFYLYHMVILNFIVHNLRKSFSSNTQFIAYLFVSIVTISIMAVLSRHFIAGRLTAKLERKLL